MEIMIRSRKCGKEDGLIKKVLSLPEDNVTHPILIVCSLSEKRRIIKTYPKMEGKIFTTDEVKSEPFIGCHPSTRHLYIDNADIVLQNMFGWKIKGISLTQD